MEFRTMVEIAKNYKSSTEARRLMRQVRSDHEQVNWMEKALHSKAKKLSTHKLIGSHSASVTTVEPYLLTCTVGVVEFALNMGAESML